MKRILSFERAAQLAGILFSATILFHTIILAGILFFDYAPVEFLWGGRLKTRDELLGFEVISLVVTSLCLVVVLIRSGRLRLPALQKAAGIVLWILVVLFLLNTVGNLLAKTTFEKSFSVVTAVMAILCARIAVGKDELK